MTYFGTRLSENISRREPEGYLICLNVPVARTGVQEYLPSELGLPEPDSRLIPVLRPEEEVFSPACMASFEGMPVTDGHPAAPEGVTALNASQLQKGHAHNIRRGAGEDRDLLLADLIITDGALAAEILGGKREISCGYNYVLTEEEGRCVQREIRGNHVAVVDAGRAGPRVSIRDRDPGIQEHQQSERSDSMKKKSLWRAKMMARMARDGDVEGLAELITETMENMDPAAVTPDSESGTVPAVQPLGAVPARFAGEPLGPVPAQPAGEPLVTAVVTAVAENLEPEKGPAANGTLPGIAAAMTAAARETKGTVPGVSSSGETEGTVPLVSHGLAPTINPNNIADCGPEILNALREIITLLTAKLPTGAPGSATDEDNDTPAPEGAAPAAEAIVAVATETTPSTPATESPDPALPSSPAPAEALEAAAEAAVAAAEAAGPLETLVAEILEEDEDPAPETETHSDAESDEDPEAIYSRILEPEQEDPEDQARTADAMRAALATFRPQLRRMTPAQRRRFTVEMAGRMKKLNDSPAGKSVYAALSKGSGRDGNPRDLGQRIMARRNANLRK